MHHHRGANHGFNGGRLAQGWYGREEEIDRDTERFDWRDRRLTRRELREEFPPEFTDEKRNEWLKWIDERSKIYSIEPTIIDRVLKNKDEYHPDVYVYSTAYGKLEVQEQFVENYVTKPVDSIMKSRAKRYPLVISPPLYDTWGTTIISPTDPPNNPSKIELKYDLMDLYLNQKLDYTEFCEDLYENYQDLDRGYYENTEAQWKIVWFDNITGELCLILRTLEWKYKDGKVEKRSKTQGIKNYLLFFI